MVNSEPAAGKVPSRSNSKQGKTFNAYTNTSMEDWDKYLPQDM